MNPDKTLNLNSESILVTTFADLTQPLVSEDDTEQNLAYVAEQVIHVLRNTELEELDLDVPVEIPIENVLNLTNNLCNRGLYPVALEILQPLRQLFPENENTNTKFETFDKFLNREDYEICWVPPKESDELLFESIAIKRRLATLLEKRQLTTDEIETAVSEYSQIQKRRIAIIKRSHEDSDIATLNGHYRTARKHIYNVLYLSGICDPKRNLPGVPEIQIQEIETQYFPGTEEAKLSLMRQLKARLEQLNYLIRESDEA